jgi:hypothetical protein
MKKTLIGGIAALAVGLTACSSSEADAPIVTGSNGKAPKLSCWSTVAKMAWRVSVSSTA